MRRLIAVALLSLSLGGCAQVGKAFDIYTTATVGFANPITPERLHAFEASAELVFIALNAYKRNCDRGNIPQSCKAAINRIRVYTLKIPPYLTRLRTFVRNNDQVNALVIYREVSDLISQVKQEAFVSNVPLGGT